MANNVQELPEDDDDAAAVIVQRLKSQGMFDTMRRECLSDIDTKPAFLNLSQRIERYVSNFLDRQEWRQDLNKNQLRERLRRNLTESNMMKYGIEHLVDGAVQAKKRSFQPEVEKIVRDMLGIEDGDVDSDSDRNEPDVDNSQQDMDVDSNESNSTHGHESEPVKAKSDAFIPSFVEVHNSSSQSSSSPPRMSIIQQLFEPIIKKEEVTPTKISILFNLPNKQAPAEQQVKDMDIETSEDDGSNHNLNEEWTEAEVKEESAEGTVERPPSKNSISDIQLPAESPPHRPPPLTKIDEISDIPIESGSPIGSTSPIEESEDEQEMDSIEAQYSPVGRREDSDEEKEEAVDQSLQVAVEEPVQDKEEEQKVQEPIQRIKEESIKKETVKEEPTEYLSDVSSVHTSDLSDFDDRLSPSSEDEQKHPSPKKPGKVVGRGRKSKEQRNLSDTRKRRASTDKSATGKPSSDSRPSTGSSTGRRERKVNPKYASDEYSSIYNRKKNQIIEEDISSDEDFEGIDNEEPNATPLQDELSNPSSEENHDKPVESAESPIEEGEVETKLKNVRKVSKRQEKYDVSDLYKPRPVIGASTSRRNRSATNPDQS